MASLQKIKMYYDPLGRVVKTVNPDNSQQWVVYGIPNQLNAPQDPSTGVSSLLNTTPTPWVNYSYDANDLASISNVSGSNAPASHYFTPKNSETDALGRTIKTIDFFDNSNYSNTIEMNYQYDIRGNLILVKDPYNREVFTHVYDLRPAQKGDPDSGSGGKQQPLPPLKTVHIDKGLSRILFDATGKPIESNDAKDAQALSAFDEISRPIKGWARNTLRDAVTLRTINVYGDSSGISSNVNGKPIESYDEAGKLEFPLYDFKGNLVTKIRSVIDDSVLQGALDGYTNYVMDWDIPPALSSMLFRTDMSYDALNRVVELELPTDLDAERKKIRPSYNRAGALEKVDLYSPAGGGTTTNYVESIAYNAKGQRLLIAFGNNRMSRYAYSSSTFRLLRQKTEGYTKSTVGDIITYAYASGTNKQDDGFNYDLVGNIVKLFIRVTDCGLTGNPDELDRIFEYDPLYRLTYADGRESDSRDWSVNPYIDVPSSPAAPGSVNYYERNYSYDKLGNIESVVQPGINGFTKGYNYNAGKNTLQEIEDGSSTTIESYTYDSCGNTLTTNLNRYYEWNHADQLICYKNQASMADPTVYAQYDYAGQDRVSKLVRTGTSVSPIYERTIYIDGIFEYVKLENGTTYEKNYIHIMDDKSRIAEFRIDGGTGPFPGDIANKTIYIVEDQIGSSVMRLSTSGTVIDEEEYYPFGDSSLRTFTYKRYRYVGKERDAESGLYYYGARYYAAWTCRFISVDPLAKDYMYLTPYNYANNNPIDDFDIDGNQDNKTKTDSGEGSKGSNPKNEVKPNLVIIIHDVDEKSNNSYKHVTGDQGDWHIIVADSMKDALKQTKEYLKENKVDNLVIETHGSLQEGTLMLDNKGGVITEKTANAYNSDKLKSDSSNKGQLNALKNISGMVKLGGNLVISSCLSACGPGGKLLAGALKTIVGDKVNFYMSEAVTTTRVTGDSENLVMGSPEIKYDGYKYHYDKPNMPTHINKTSEQFIKIGSDGSTRDVGNFQMNEKGKAAIEFKKVDQKTKK